MRRRKVTFADPQMLHRSHQDEGSSEVTQSDMAGSETRPGHEACVRIPRAMTAAPFLQHSALTPAQRDFLYTVAASRSPAHARSIITQHYLNVLHRCIRAGCTTEEDDAWAAAADEGRKDRSEDSSKPKVKGKINTKAKDAGKPFLPSIPNRFSNKSASKQGKTKKRRETSPLRRKSPSRGRRRLVEVEELDGSLSSLSLAGWEEDLLSHF